MDERTRVNLRDWNDRAETYQAHHASQMVERPLAWGTWNIAESDVNVLGDVSGQSVLEVGCGAGHFIEALTALGAKSVGVDLSEQQLAHARERSLASESSMSVVCADGAVLPFCDTSFDLVCSNYGAMGWADPRIVVPEVARVLRRDGVFIWAWSTPLHAMCFDEATEQLDAQLHNDYSNVRVWTTPGGGGGVRLSHGETVRVLVAAGFEVLDLIELIPGPNDSTSWPWLAPEEWARRWPVDEIWKARKK